MLKPTSNESIKKMKFDLKNHIINIIIMFLQYTKYEIFNNIET